MTVRTRWHRIRIDNNTTDKMIHLVQHDRGYTQKVWEIYSSSDDEGYGGWEFDPSDTGTARKNLE